MSINTIALSATPSLVSPGFHVDEERGIIRGAAIMSVGVAEGHGFSIDAVTLSQVHGFISAKPNGAAVRFKHPPLPSDKGEPQPMAETLGTEVGYVRNTRIEGNVLRGDVHLMPYAEVLPGLGDVKSYLLSKAKTDPMGLGLSAVIAFELEPASDGVMTIVARVYDVEAVDFVGRPAANKMGLLATNEEAKAHGEQARYSLGIFTQIGPTPLPSEGAKRTTGMLATLTKYRAALASAAYATVAHDFGCEILSVDCTGCLLKQPPNSHCLAHLFNAGIAMDRLYGGNGNAIGWGPEMENYSARLSSCAGDSAIEASALNAEAMVMSRRPAIERLAEEILASGKVAGDAIPQLVGRRDNESIAQWGEWIGGDETKTKLQAHLRARIKAAMVGI